MDEDVVLLPPPLLVLPPLVVLPLPLALFWPEDFAVPVDEVPLLPELGAADELSEDSAELAAVVAAADEALVEGGAVLMESVGFGAAALVLPSVTARRCVSRDPL